MPIFDYKCSCGEVKKDEFVKAWDSVVKCNQCGKLMKKLVITSFTPDVFPADGIHLEHVSSEGKTFYSKKEMRQYAKTHDLELGAL